MKIVKFRALPIVFNLLLAIVGIVSALLLVEGLLRFFSDWDQTSVYEIWYKNRAVNSLGYRGDDYSFTKPDGVFRIMILGDSLAFGTLVPNVEDTFPKKLEKYLNEGFSDKKFEVLNISHGGWRTGDEIYALVKDGIRFSPDLIFLAYFHNDIPDFYRYYEENCKNPVDRMWTTFKQAIQLDLFSIVKKSKIYAYFIPRIELFLENKGFKTPYTNCLAQLYETRGWDMQKIYFDTLESFAEVKNIHLVLGFLPFIYKLGEEYPFLKANSKLMKYCQQRGLSCIDFYEEGFQKENEMELSAIYPDFHLNARGNDILARIIYKHLNNLKNLGSLSMVHRGFSTKELLQGGLVNAALDSKFKKLKNENVAVIHQSKSKFGSDANKLTIDIKNGKYSIQTYWTGKNGKIEKFRSRIELDRKGRLLESTLTIVGDKTELIKKKKRMKNGEFFLTIENPNGKILARMREGAWLFCDPLYFERKIYKGIVNPEKKLPLKTTYLNLSCLYRWKHYFNQFVEDILDRRPEAWFLRPLEKVYRERHNNERLKKLYSRFPDLKSLSSPLTELEFTQ